MSNRYDFSRVSPALQKSAWSAAWASHPSALAHTGDTGAVFLFRKTLTIATVPETFIVHVSADQRYHLFVNGVSVTFGPARGDLLHWNYETVDLAPFLSPGENVLAARVHLFVGENAPVAQITSGFPAFLMQGDTDAEGGVNTPTGWCVAVDEAYTFTNEPASKLWTYAVVGASEIFDAAKHPHGWNVTGFDDTGWLPAKNLKKAAPHGTSDAETYWWLVPRTVPLMVETPVSLGTVRRGMPLERGASFTIPANRSATRLFDHGANVCALPTLTVSGGAGSTITLGYAEGLQDITAKPNLNAKGNRDDINGKELRGYVDTWKPAGGDAAQTLDTLHWRTFRYTELTITTAGEPLTVHALGATATGYPWERRATFDAPEMLELAAIRETGWRTLRLCSHETFMDCPYYEQLQYAGDTRIQALATLYETGDARLFKNALLQYDDSRAAFGLTMSRYPSRIPQVISPFSLWWVCMVEDYFLHVPDSA
ncbi:MAG: alpha-L-rhamnosidase N-terminal domain-containing protein, partial [Armatimonadetes bacterium]|nr:alpha-L-rhamnosidase N-terminal domain-containing protein [Armatimonadota bacterium]